ncbi:glyoxalase/bleomycin resistance/extradiol dioxygenase family protein [Sulfurovum sp.]|uniref:VOC family protein n=1 Tax=Sulfurovum sp. TaxID=1969726 RepID=UPI0025CC4A76|nr:VOC family protein [Sulfurovum sp.]
MKRLTPNLAVKDVREAVNYYVENFGFKLVMAVSEDKSSIGDELADDKVYVWANVMYGEIGFMFQTEDSLKEDVGEFFAEIGSSSSFYIEVENVDSLYENVKDKVEILKEIGNTWYGAREFYVRDCNGYVLGFSAMQVHK